MRPHLNKGLFSNYYLDRLLPREEEFNIPLSEAGRSLEEIKRIWDKQYISSLSEPQLRKHFLDKVFEILGWAVDVEPPTPSGEWAKHPDYALFGSKEDLRLLQSATKEEYFKSTLCLGEAKRWGRPLDKKVKVDPEDPQNPSLQISRYLWLTEVKWGILTDGRYWRLYERETSKRLDIFYEIDLEDLVENGSPEDFKYFYLFFRRHAFPDFLEKVYKESIDYAEAVGEELKENVYKALKALAQGFLKTPENDLKESYLKDIHDNSLIFLYRLLFILYAEHRGLLPVGENQIYTESYSLDVFKKEIADKLDKHETIATSTHGYWNKLKELFEIINIGNPELGVPPYNGGLFDPDKHQFLERYKVGDLYIAKAVDLLSRSSDRSYIDYGSLEIRHLGSIYEGLLEYKLKIAENELVPVKERGKEVFIHLEEAKKVKKKIKEEEIIREGEIYLVTDKGERKATGSYYTPDYIVNYIIDNTLGPLVERIYWESKLVQEIKNNIRHFNEIFEEIVKGKGEEEKENLVKLWNMTRNNQGRRDFLLNLLDGAEPSHGYDPLKRILQLKVLDPAMGSGHFLVEATDFLARELLNVLSGEPFLKSLKEMVIGEAKEPCGSKEQEEEDIRWARREVVERCIFGVDLNPLAVELTKLSLWLYTVAKNRPLNFLDHHLRCGNSLIGASIDDLVSLPSLKKRKLERETRQLGIFENAFREKVTILLKSFELIESVPSDTVEQVREKERYYRDFRGVLSRFQDVADIWTSIYFGNDVDFGSYQMLQDNLRSPDEEWKILRQETWFEKGKSIADKKRFLHWELEFPEVFFEGHQKKKNPGFDGVVGNPPYGINILKLDRDYYKKVYNCAQGEVDSYLVFIEKAELLTAICKRVAFIVPDTWFTLYTAQPLRDLLIKKTRIVELTTLNERVFEGGMVDPMLLFFSKDSYQDSGSGMKIQILSKSGTQSDFESGNFLSIHYIPQKYWIENPHLAFRVNISAKALHVVIKAMKNSQPFSNVLEFKSGCKPYEEGKGDPPQTKEILRKKPFTSESKRESSWMRLIRGDDIKRYSLEVEKDEWILYGRWLAAQRDFKIFSSPRILIQSIRNPGIKQRFVATFETQSIISRINVYSLLIKEGVIEYDLKFLLALINSRFLNWLLKQTYGLHTYIITGLQQVPIPLICFETPREKRKSSLEDAKKLYFNALDRLEIGVKDELAKFRNLFLFSMKILNRKEYDAAHDLLSFFASQMIETKVKQQSEIKGLLEWLESQLRIKPDRKGNTGIETLNGKTHIKNYVGDYYKEEEHLPFEEFWKILEKNKTRIQANLKSRDFFEDIKTEYEKSLSKLFPLKEKLRKTDWLIDQIVYKLYGLTEDEIKLVEN